MTTGEKNLMAYLLAVADTVDEFKDEGCPMSSLTMAGEARGMDHMMCIATIQLFTSNGFFKNDNFKIYPGEKFEELRKLVKMAKEVVEAKNG